mmetsp:Transcript_14604/g.22531  ORF Transcript_14604/g.22531 Transcript_14604/m.22531 type:complete len:329 (-) Transcript_14604:1959-2945(-)
MGIGASISKKITKNMEKQLYAVRRAHYAGQWYNGVESDLDAELTNNLANVDSKSQLDSDVAVRGLVGPHAGYSYSGPTAAHAYKHLNFALRLETITTILVLHPSHHVYLNGCALSGANKIETPIGDIQVASELRKELWKTEAFSIMSQTTDENEHSGELHYPYIAKSIKEANAFGRVRILPIMVGSINTSQEEQFGRVLKDIISRDDTITVVSTDFCHWGSRFQYQPTPTAADRKMPIFEYISELDHAGMNFIEMQEPGAFATYIRETRNTICGRHPLSVWLHAVSQNRESGTEKLSIKFVRYAQSSQVKSMRESSVSYASAVATREI